MPRPPPTISTDEAQVGAVKVAVAAGKNVRYHSADAAQVGTVASISIWLVRMGLERVSANPIQDTAGG